MSRNKVDELTRHAVAQVQKLAKDQGFKRLPDEKAFMDDLSGEDDGIEAEDRVHRCRAFATAVGVDADIGGEHGAERFQVAAA